MLLSLCPILYRIPAYVKTHIYTHVHCRVPDMYEAHAMSVCSLCVQDTDHTVYVHRTNRSM